MSTILVAEDEELISSFIAKGLRAAGHTPLVVDDGAAALEAVRSGVADLLVLDLGLPDVDGLDVLSALRGEGHRLPVIVLTARATVDATVATLKGGADDYMAKPFSFEELLARIALRLRSAAAATAAPAPSRVEAGGVTLDLLGRRCAVDGEDVVLSTREFDLALALLRRPGHVLSREQLLSQVWGMDFDPRSNIVDVYVRYLRKKLGTGRITAVRGVGYRFETDPPAAWR